MGIDEFKLQGQLWRKRVAKGFAAAAARDNKDIIRISTESLGELMENHVLRLLSIRSTAYEKEGLLSRALEDATKMIQYVPTSASGYLRTGSIHITNGKADLAADNYRHGLEIVSKSHPGYHEMEKEYIKAVYRAQSHFDIVANLPLKVLYKVLVCLDMERVWICLTVSRRWCNQISQCGTWWASVIVTQTGTELDKAMCDAIPLVKDHIQHLQLKDSLCSDLNKRYLTHLKYGVFTNLKTLSLKEGFLRNINVEDFAIALWQIRNTLTSLKLTFGPSKSYHLHSVLSTCPNLEELSYTTPENISITSGDEDGSYSSGVIFSKLLSLELFYGGTNYDALCFYLSLCPNLRRLLLMSSSAQPLGDPGSTTFTDYCPKLKILGLNSTEDLSDINFSELTTDSNGVAYMNVKFDHHFIWPESARHIVAQSHSIQHLRIDQTEDHDKSYGGTYYNLNSCLYTKLRTFRYTSYGLGDSFFFAFKKTFMPVVETFACKIIQTSSRLSELSLSCLSGSTSLRNTVEQSILKKIQVLNLNSVSFRSTTAIWYKGFLSSLWQVKTLVIRDCEFLDDTTLSWLAEAKSIQHLIVADCAGISDAGLMEFFKTVALRPSHQLDKLDLDNISASLTISAIRFLVKIKTLKALHITNCNIESDIVNGLIGHAPYSALKTIKILDCFPADIAATWADFVCSLKKKGITLVIE